MKIPSRSILLLLGALYILSLFLNLGLAPLEFEEPRRALIALEMEHSGDFLVPHQIGEFYYKKPPVFNWVLYGFSKVFGHTEFAYRLVTVLSLLAMGLMIYRWVKRHHSVELAYFSAAGFLLSAHMYYYLSMLAEIDTFYSAITLLMIIVFYDGFSRSRYGYMYILGYALCAVGVLTKGFPSIVFVCLTLFALWIIGRFKFKPFLNLWHLGGLAIGLTIAGGYFYLYSNHNSLEPLFEGLWSQSSERTPLENSTMDTVMGIFTNIAVFMKDMLPFTLFLPLLLFKRIRKVVWSNQFLRTVLIIFLINLIPYLISPGARSRYLMMLYPLGIIFLAGLGYTAWKEFKSFNLPILIFGGILILGLVGSGVFALTYEDVKLIDHYYLFSIVLIVIAGTGAVLIWKSPQHAMTWVFLLMIGVRFGVDFFFVPLKAREGEMAEVKQNAEAVAEITKGEDLWLWKQEHDRSFSLGMAFYLNRERDDIIEMDVPCNTDDFYIIHKGDAKNTTYKIFYSFEWKEHQYYLIKFTDCQNG